MNTECLLQPECRFLKFKHRIILCLHTAWVVFSSNVSTQNQSIRLNVVVFGVFRFVFRMHQHRTFPHIQITQQQTWKWSAMRTFVPWAYNDCWEFRLQWLFFSLYWECFSKSVQQSRNEPIISLHLSFKGTFNEKYVVVLIIQRLVFMDVVF